MLSAEKHGDVSDWMSIRETARLDTNKIAAPTKNIP